MNTRSTYSAARAGLASRRAISALLVGILMVSLQVSPVFATTVDPWESDDSAQNVPVLATDDLPFARALQPEGDVDWFELSVTAGHTYVIESSASSSDPWFDAVLDVYSADQTMVLASDDDGGVNLMPKVTFVAPRTENVLLRISAHSYWATGDYSVQARMVDAARISGTLTGVADLGLPGAKVSVFAEDTTGWSLTAEAVSDASGNFTVALEAGTYRVGYATAGSSSPTSFWPEAPSVAEAQDLVLAENGQIRLGTVCAVPWTRVSGTLTTSDPLVSPGNVSIAAYRYARGTWEAFSWTVTDAAGDWSMPLAYGTYKFSYSESSGLLGSIYHPAASSISLAEEVVVDAATPRLEAVLAQPAEPPGPVDVVSVAGVDRYDTAVRISQRAFPDGAEALIVVTGTSWPDGLGAASLAGSLDAPILLVKGNSVPEVVQDEAQRLGVKRVIIVGGTGAVGTQSEAFFAAAVGAANVERIGGADRYETARLVAERTIECSGAAWDGTYILASGVAFPDVLAASPLAAAQGWPVLLTKPSTLSPTTARFIAENPSCSAIVVGGSSAVSEGVASAVTALSGSSSQRLSGANRYETALSIAAYAAENGLLGNERLAVATGQDFPDALTCSVLQARNGSVLLLTPRSSLNADVAAMLQALPQGECAEVVFVGGAAAISPAVREQVAATLER